MDSHGQGVRNSLELLGLQRGALEVFQRISELGRLLEVEVGSSLAHLDLQFAAELLGVPFEEPDAGADLFQVLLTGDVGDAGSRAVLKVAVQAVPVIRLIGVQRTAAPKLELSSHEGQRPTHAARMGEGTEVEAAVVFPQARQREAGNGVVEVDL